MQESISITSSAPLIWSQVESTYLFASGGLSIAPTVATYQLNVESIDAVICGIPPVRNNFPVPLFIKATPHPVKSSGEPTSKDSVQYREYLTKVFGFQLCTPLKRILLVDETEMLSGVARI